MAMASIGEALTAASSFLGRGARLRTDALSGRPEADDEDAFAPPLDGLAPGEPCFEAVAEALAEAGYLDSWGAFRRRGYRSGDLIPHRVGHDP